MSCAQSNPYRVLGIPDLSGMECVKRAYKDLALQYHPDKDHSSADCVNFIQIQHAYETLSDRSMKSDIDTQLQTPVTSVCQDSVRLGDMETVGSGVEYKYACRCGGEYVIEGTEISSSDDELIVPCTTCTLVLRVLLTV